MTATARMINGLRSVMGYMVQGTLKITHNGFALLGLTVAGIAIALVTQPDLRLATETQLRDWLLDRQTTATGFVPDTTAVDRTTAVNPKDLPKQQAAVAYWLSKKYNIAPEPLGALVAEAWEIGAREKLDPALILAVMAVESGFNPFAQSPVGAQGLMQVMTNIHKDKYQSFGGQLAAFDPVSNLRVGIRVLQDCIAKTGSIEGGLKYYVGAGMSGDDGGYSARVFAEYNRIKLVAEGKPASANTASASMTPAPTHAPSSASATTVAPMPTSPVETVASASDS